MAPRQASVKYGVLELKLSNLNWSQSFTTLPKNDLGKQDISQTIDIINKDGTYFKTLFKLIPAGLVIICSTVGKSKHPIFRISKRMSCKRQPFKNLEDTYTVPNLDLT